jgi:putative colanic acid biosynthesis glycosyltransferase
MNFIYSIITVTLNNYKGLLDTYKSVNDQTYKNFEWIIVDGYSTDQTRKFLESFDEKDLTLKFISETDSGIYNAMNRGIALSEGDFLIFLNAGDLFADKNVLKDVESSGFLSKYDVIYGNSFEQTEKGYFHKTARSHTFIWYGMFTHHQAIFYSKHTLINNQYSENLFIASDFELTSRLFQLGYSFKFIDRVICKFELGGLSTSNFVLSLKEQLFVRSKIFKFPSLLCYFLYLLQYIFFIIRFNFPFVYTTFRKYF